MAHGEWMHWVKRNFHLRQSSATAYMKLATVTASHFKHTENVSRGIVREGKQVPLWEWQQLGRASMKACRGK